MLIFSKIQIALLSVSMMSSSMYHTVGTRPSCYDGVMSSITAGAAYMHNSIKHCIGIDVRHYKNRSIPVDIQQQYDALVDQIKQYHHILQNTGMPNERQEELTTIHMIEAIMRADTMRKPNQKDERLWKRSKLVLASLHATLVHERMQLEKDHSMLLIHSKYFINLMTSNEFYNKSNNKSNFYRAWYVGYKADMYARHRKTNLKYEYNICIDSNGQIICDLQKTHRDDDIESKQLTSLPEHQELYARFIGIKTLNALSFE